MLKHNVHVLLRWHAFSGLIAIGIMGFLIHANVTPADGQRIYVNGAGLRAMGKSWSGTATIATYKETYGWPWTYRTRVPLMSFGDWNQYESTGLILNVLVASGITAIGLIAAMLFERIMSRFVPSKGHCLQCGYDLRGSVGRMRCPECGERIDAAKLDASD